MRGGASSLVRSWEGHQGRGIIFGGNKVGAGRDMRGGVSSLALGGTRGEGHHPWLGALGGTQGEGHHPWLGAGRDMRGGASSLVRSWEGHEGRGIILG